MVRVDITVVLQGVRLLPAEVVSADQQEEAEAHPISELEVLT
jgi:hypothetical protein